MRPALSKATLALAAGLLFGFPSLAQSTVAGAIAGKFAVSSTGAATYRIPVQVPPGIAGIQPKLELAYSSQSGNGLLGLGWNLSGISSITRCAKTMASDGVRGTVNFDANDRYCLDGQKLILVSGTYGAAGSQYRTEVETFSRITANGAAGNAPASFTVKTKDGLTIEYGNTADSRIEAQGQTNVRVWATNKISDIKNNALAITYDEDSVNGEFTPNTITYGANSVQFSFEARSDARTAYLAGVKSTNSKRLKELRTLVGTNVAQKYVLNYGASASTQRSILSSVQLCDAANNCQTPTQLEYGVDANALNTTSTSWTLPATEAGGYISRSDATGQLQGLVDMNGDGLADFYKANTGQVWLNNGAGFAASPTAWAMPATGPAKYLSTTAMSDATPVMGCPPGYWLMSGSEGDPCMPNVHGSNYATVPMIVLSYTCPPHQSAGWQPLRVGPNPNPDRP
jgi:hypothetical protein